VSAIRPWLRRLELRRATEEGGLVAEGRHELDTEREACLRPGERHQDRRVPCGVEGVRFASALTPMITPLHLPIRYIFS